MLELQLQTSKALRDMFGFHCKKAVLYLQCLYICVQK